MIDPSAKVVLPPLAELTALSEHDGPWVVGMSECSACGDEELSVIPYLGLPVMNARFACFACGRTTGSFIGLNEKARQLGRLVKPPPPAEPEPKRAGPFYRLILRLRSKP